MKKIISIIVILIFTVCYCITSLATLTKPVTKASLTDAFNEYAKGFSGSYNSENGRTGAISFGESKPIEVTDSQLIDKSYEREPVYINYSLGDTPKFWTKIELTPETDISSVSELKKTLEKTIIGLLGIVISQDVPMGDAYHYYNEIESDIKAFKYNSSYSSTVIGNQLTITLDEESKTYEKGKINYDELVPFLLEENKVIKDEKKGIFTYTVGYKKNSDNNYTVEATLEINKNADFSKIGKATEENTNQGNDSNNNALNNDSKKNTTNNTTNSTSKNTIKNNTVSAVTSNKTNTNSNITKKEALPKAGADNVIPLVLTFLCVISISLAIRIISFKDIK